MKINANALVMNAEQNVNHFGKRSKPMNEIEEKFYKTFGIEQEYQYHVRDRGRSYVGNKQMLIDKKHLFMDKERKRSRSLYVANVSKIYPKITDRILLELICILNDFEGINVKGTTIKELKEELLKQCIEPFEYPIAFEEHHEIDKLYHQVQSLFKGGE